MVVPMSQMYINTIKVFRSDCDNLIDIFRNKKNKDAKTFLSIWKSLNFHLVYDRKSLKHGMQYDFEYDTLQIAKQIMVCDHFSGGMLLLYALHCLQDCPLSNIRLEVQEFKYIIKMLSLKEEESSTLNYDIAWIFSTLLKEAAFKLVVFSREYDMEGQYRAQMVQYKKYEFCDNDDNPKTFTPKEWLRNISKDIPQDMKGLEEEYLNMKNKVKQVFPSLNLSLDMVQEDIYSMLLKSLTQLDTKVEPGKVDDSIGARRRSLKNRKLKRKSRYDLDYSDEETTQNTLTPKARKKPGCPTGERKLFFKKIINDPDENVGSHDEDEEDSFMLNRKRTIARPSLPKI